MSAAEGLASRIYLFVEFMLIYEILLMQMWIQENSTTQCKKVKERQQN